MNMRTSAVKYEMNMQNMDNYEEYEINTKTRPKSQTCKFIRSDAAFEIDTSAATTQNGRRSMWVARGEGSRAPGLGGCALAPGAQVGDPQLA